MKNYCLRAIIICLLTLNISCGASEELEGDSRSASGSDSTDNSGQTDNNTDDSKPDEKTEENKTKVCSPGIKRCDGKKLEQCSSDGYSYELVEDCAAIPTASICESYECRISGCYRKPVNYGKNCDDGNFCTENEVCDARGVCGSGDSKACGDKKVCDEVNDQCVDQLCTPNNTFCENGKIFTCNDKGTGKLAGQGQICEYGCVDTGFSAECIKNKKVKNFIVYANSDSISGFWEKPNAGLTYRVEKDSDKEFKNPALLQESTKTSFEDKGLGLGVRNYYRVTIIENGNSLGPSEVVTAKTSKEFTDFNSVSKITEKTVQKAIKQDMKVFNDLSSHIAFIQNDSQKQSLFYTKKPKDGAFSSIEAVENDDSYDVIDLKLELDSAGLANITYLVKNTDDSLSIYFTKFSSTLNIWSTPVRIDKDTSSEIIDLDFKLADTHLVIAWIEGNGAGDYEVKIAKNNGSGFSAEEILSDNSKAVVNKGMRISLDKDGQVFVAWSELINSVGHVYGKFFDGTDWTSKIDISLISGGVASSVDLAQSGDFIIAAWSEQASNYGDIYVADFDKTTKSFGPKAQIATATFDPLIKPKVAANKNGTAVVLMTEDTTFSQSVYGTYRAGRTSTWTPKDTLQRYNIEDIGNFFAHVDDSGKAYVFWEDYQINAMQTEYAIYDSQTSLWSEAESLAFELSGKDLKATLETSFSNAGSNELCFSWIKWNFDIAFSCLDGEYFDIEKVVFGSESSGSLNHISAIDENGNILVVWDKGDDLYASYYNSSDQTWSNSEEIDDKGNNSKAIQPELKFNDNGDAFVTWYQQRDVDTNLSSWYAVFEKSTKTWRSAELLETGDTGAAGLTKLAIDKDGNPHFIWMENDGTAFNVLSRKYDLKTKALNTVTRLDAGFQGQSLYPQISRKNENTLIAVWLQQEVNELVPFFNTFDEASGQWQKAEKIASVSAGFEASDIYLEGDHFGNAHVIWKESNSSEQKVMFSMLDKTNNWSAPSDLSSNTVSYVAAINFKEDGNGNLLATWMQYDLAGWEIAGNYMLKGEGWASAAVTIVTNTGIDNELLRPVLASDTSGKFLLAYEDVTSSRTDLKFALFQSKNRFDSNYKLGFSAPKELESESGTSFIPMLGGNGEGNYSAFWTQYTGESFRLHYRLGN